MAVREIQIIAAHRSPASAAAPSRRCSRRTSGSRSSPHSRTSKTSSCNSRPTSAWCSASLRCSSAWAWLSAARDEESPVPRRASAPPRSVAQNAFDFSLEIPGVAIPFAVVMAAPRATSGPSAYRRGRFAPQHSARPARHRWCRHVPRAPYGENASRIAAASTADDAVSLAREILPWHPHRLGPARRCRKPAPRREFRCDEAEPWLLRAMERNIRRGACLAIEGKHALASAYARVHPGLPRRTRRGSRALPGKGRAPRRRAGHAGRPHRRGERAPRFTRGGARALQRARARRARRRDARTRQHYGGGAPARAETQELSPQDPQGSVVAARALDTRQDRTPPCRSWTSGRHACRRRGALTELGLRHLRARRFSQAKAVFDILAREARRWRGRSSSSRALSAGPATPRRSARRSTRAMHP